MSNYSKVSTNAVSETRTRAGRITIVIALFLLAFTLRGLAVTGLRHWGDAPSLRHGHDGVEFDRLARSLAERGEYAFAQGQPTAFRAPGFPLALAALYKVFGTSYVLAHVALCLMGAAACHLTYEVARLLLPEPVARLAGLFCAVYLPHIYFSTVFFSENLFALLVVLEVWLLLREYDRWSMIGMALAGAVLGYAALVRPFALLLLPLLILVLLARQLRIRQLRFGAIAAFAVGFFMVIAPWVIRNERVFGRLVLVATNGGATFYGGNNSIVAGSLPELGTWVSTVKLPSRDLIDAQPDEVAHDQMEWKLGWQWVRLHPDQLPRLELGKFIRALMPDVDSPNRAYVLASLLFATPLIGLFLFGVVRSLRDATYWTTSWLLIHAVLLGTLLTCLIFWGSPRFRDAIAPLLMIYAAQGASAIQLRRRPAAKETTHAENSQLICAGRMEAIEESQYRA
jgi:4-amino-4-deoxy-L-arabinose transferase-like glycosyltransferase